MWRSWQQVVADHSAQVLACMHRLSSQGGSMRKCAPAPVACFSRLSLHHTLFFTHADDDMGGGSVVSGLPGQHHEFHPRLDLRL